MTRDRSSFYYDSPLLHRKSDPKTTTATPTTLLTPNTSTKPPPWFFWTQSNLPPPTDSLSLRSRHSRSTGSTFVASTKPLFYGPGQNPYNTGRPIGPPCKSTIGQDLGSPPHTSVVNRLYPLDLDVWKVLRVSLSPLTSPSLGPSETTHVEVSEGPKKRVGPKESG